MLYNETTFYSALAKDMLQAKREVIIYSPFVSAYRVEMFCRLLSKLSDTDVKVYIFTRAIDEYTPSQRYETAEILAQYEEAGAVVHYLRGYIHEKVAIIDREILWEGSLNILSQRSSREMMRRIADKNSAEQVIRHLRLESTLSEGRRAKHSRPSKVTRKEVQSKRRITLRTLAFCWLVVMAGWWLFLAVLDTIPLNVVMSLVELLTANTPQGTL